MGFSTLLKKIDSPKELMILRRNNVVWITNYKTIKKNKHKEIKEIKRHGNNKQ